MVNLASPAPATDTPRRPVRVPHTLDAAAELDGEELVPGFRLSVATIFT